MDKFNTMPDFSCHNESLTVGDAVSELMKHSLKLQQIRFNIVKKHPSMGEIVSQNMTHENIFSTSGLIISGEGMNSDIIIAIVLQLSFGPHFFFPAYILTGGEGIAL